MENHEAFVVKTYTRAWCVGSGLVAVLQPGAHRITGRTNDDGQSKVIVDDRYYLSEEEFAKLLSDYVA